LIHEDYKIDPIKGIDIDRQNVTDYPLTGKFGDDKNLSLKRFELFAETKIDRGKKIITITSGLRISNKLNIPYHLSISDGDQNVFKTTINPEETKSLPFD